MPDFATWNPADKAPGLVLSNGDLDVDNTTSTWNTVRATIFNTTGKWYMEFECIGSNPSNLMIGFGTADMFLGTTGSNHGIPGFDASDYGWGYQAGRGRRWNQNSFTTSYSSASQNDIIRIKADLDAGELWLAVNGGAFETPRINIIALGGREVYPAVGLLSTESEVRANFGASAFAFSVPSGYNAGWFVADGAAGNINRKLGRGLTRGLGRGL